MNNPLKILYVIPKARSSKGFAFLNDNYFNYDELDSDVFYLDNKSRYNLVKNIIKLSFISSHYDIIHFEFSGFYLLFSPLLSINSALVYSIRGSDIQGNPSESVFKKFLRKVVFWLFGGFPKGFIAVSDSLRCQLPKRFISRCIVIPTPLNNNFIAPILNLKLDNRRYLIGIVCGVPVNSKNEIHCIRAVELIKNFYNFDIDCVMLDGSFSSQEMPLILKSLDLVISASTSEGSPNIIRESVSVGTSVVCYDCGDTIQRFGLMSGVLIVPLGVDFLVNGIVNSLFPKFLDKNIFLEPFNLKNAIEKRINFYRNIIL